MSRIWLSPSSACKILLLTFFMLLVAFLTLLMDRLIDLILGKVFASVVVEMLFAHCVLLL